MNARTGLPYPLDFELAANDDPAQGFWDEATRTRAFGELIALKVRTVGPLLATSFLFILGMSLLAGYAKPLMAVKVVGATNVGYLLVFLTYVLCWIVSLAYVRAANIQFDAQARAAANVVRRGVRP
ncbi:DUF485 domain-containing protein [Ramlibacter sp. AN1133]|uniref:DUF485 domain-containing protein n=1 Tax=Ramlibacter sp. AN1133 TaxID=3133429 RepID=UPI0030BEF031